MILLTLRDLQYRASRIVTVVIGTAVVFTLLFLMSGLVEQFHREPEQTVERLGATAWLVRAGASGVFTSAATVDPALAGSVRSSGRVDPLVAARHSIRKPAETIDIVVIGSVADGLGRPSVDEGRPPAASGEVVVDRSSDLAVGDPAVIGERTFEVVGLSQDTTLFAGMPLVFMDLADAQSLVYRGQPLATALVSDGAVQELPEGLQVLTPAAVAADATRPLERSISSVNLIRVLLWIVAAMIVGAVVYLSALERNRDFAILKAVGTSTRGLAGGLVLQSIAIALLAAVIAAVLQAGIAPVFPLTVSVPGRALVQVPLLAAGVAALAALGGIRKVIKADPAAAFAGPGG